MATTEPSPTQAQTQCWECLRREVECDGLQPCCNTCQSASIVCPGFKNEKPLTWLPPGKVSRFGRKKSGSSKRSKSKTPEHTEKENAVSNKASGKRGTRRGQTPKPTARKGTGSDCDPQVIVTRAQTRCNYGDADVVEASSRDDTPSLSFSGFEEGNHSDSSCSSMIPKPTDLFLTRKACNIPHQQTMEFDITEPNIKSMALPVLRREHFMAPSDLKPKDWDFAEALRFYERIFEEYMPNVLTPSILTLPLTAETMSRMEPSLRDSFVASAVAFHLSGACWKLGNFDPNPSGPVGRLWETYLHYIGRSIQTLNESLAAVTVDNIDKVFCAINGLLNAEISLSRTSHWRAHVGGFLSFMRMCGGLHGLVESSTLRVTVPVLTFVVKCTLANTTSPCHDQIAEVTSFDDADLRKLYSVCTYPTFPYPVDLFLSIVRINRLRLQHGTDPTTNTTNITTSSSVAEPKILDLLSDIQAFNTTEWVQTWDPPNSTRLTLAAEIFQSAVALYCLTSLLQTHTTNSTSAASSSTSASTTPLLPCLHANAKAFHLNRLLTRLPEALDTIAFREILIWPLLVAGIAAQRPEQRELVRVLLGRTAEEAVFSRWAAEGLGVLVRAWSRGAVLWDEYFDRPYFIL